MKTGGRGKAGGIKPAPGPAAAEDAARAILGMDIKGHLTRSVLVEVANVPAEEYYAAFLVDRAAGTFLAMCSASGGMEIEELAVTDPGALVKVPIDPLRGVDHETASFIVTEAGLPSDVAGEAVEILVGLWKVMAGEDAVLVEVNPLARTADGRVLALDGKVTLDENADYRHDRPAEAAAGGDDLESRAKSKGSTTSSSTAPWA